jgi:uroporphyrinogen decarboxylase
MHNQAGRFLPEYRALRAKVGTVLDLAYAPKLAAEAASTPRSCFRTSSSFPMR